MLVIPAIDLLGGKCVRLRQGDYGQVETYELDPVEVAQSFVAAGAKRIHIVDLDAAKHGSSSNRPLIGKIRKNVRATVEVGGGIRTEKDIEELIEQGIDRLVVGTLLAQKPEIVAGWVKKYGQKFIAGIDAKDGEVKVAGWEQGSKLQDLELAARCKDWGMISIIYTNIARDGMLEGPDLQRTLAVADAAQLPVILSGGISSLDDFATIRSHSHPLLYGIITGKAIYKNRIDLAQVMSEFQSEVQGGLW